MATTVTFAVNADTTDSPYGTSGVDWRDMDIDNDTLLFSAGSSTVKDGEPIPSETELTSALTVIDPVTDTEVAKCFLEDYSDNLLREIHNYADNKRYVFAAYFNGATASEPVLEIWDNEDLDSTDLNSLGAGVADDSWWRGITTTDGLPGASWTGTKLAGSEANHFLYLNNNNGALSGAGTLYFNLKIIVPGGTEQSGLEVPTLVIKFTTN